MFRVPMRRFLLSAALLASPATAQDLSYASLAIDHSERSTFFGDDSIQRLDGKVEVSFGDFILGADVDAFKSTFIAEQGTLQVFAGYRITPNLTAGLSVGRTGKFGEMDDQWSVWGSYDSDTFALGAEVVTLDEDSTTLLAGEVMPTAGLTLAGYGSKGEGDAFYRYGLEATYSAPAYDLTLFAELSTGDDLDLIGLRGTYRLSDQFDIGGGIGEWQSPGGQSRTAYFVTAGYRVAEGVRAYSTLTSRDVGVIDDTTGVRLGLTFDLGKSARTADRITSRIDDLAYDFE